MTLRADDFQFLANLLKQQSGLVVGEDKIYLLESRLLPLARKFNLNSIDEICARLRGMGDTKLSDAVVETMTANDTIFFRDSKPFDQFRSIILPALLEKNAGKKSLRIWSAACASGQETYSIAMILAEAAEKLIGWQVDILGTDLSKAMIERANDGVYTQFEVQRGLPIHMLIKYFTQESDRWKISRELKNMVKFRTFNLLNDLGSLGNFDVVFCRNVLSYFDRPTRARVLAAIGRIMPPHGVLILGATETVLGVSDKFKLLDGQRGVYVLSANNSYAAAPAVAARA